MRALLAAIAAVMITFTADHSAALGLSVFSGFTVATGLILLLSAWLVFPRGERWSVISVGIVDVLAGMISGVPAWRSAIFFLVVVVVWAILTGFLEALAGWRRRRTASRVGSRDALTVGIVTVVLGVVLLFVSPQYALDYTIAETARTYTLTGITIAVGIFGGYAAVVAVYLGIAGFSPTRRGDAIITAERQTTHE